MPEKQTRERAAAKRAKGDSPSTQAGEYVREEIHHIREGKHGAKNAKQAIAIGLSKARRDGVDIPPQKGAAGKSTANKTSEPGTTKRVSAKRSKASLDALKEKPRSAASHEALSRHAKKVARDRE